MPKFNRKPFEDHIESNDFDLNPLIGAGTNVPHHVLHPRLETWLNTLPHPLITGRWDDQLDDMQKRLRHSLVMEIVERGMLDEFSEQLEGIDEETIKVLLHYPITLTMLSQDYFRQNGYPYGWETPDIVPDKQSSANKRSLRQMMRHLLWGTFGFFHQLFARFR